MSEAVAGFQLSLQQGRLWRLALTSAEPWRARLALDLAGELDPPALQAALGRVVERHEILRTRFPLVAGMTLPLQVVAPAATALSWGRGDDHAETGDGADPFL